MGKELIRVAVTGGAGQINYNLLFRIANGDLFGSDQPVAINILELPVAMQALEGVAMELDDCAFPLLKDLVLTDDVNKAMTNVNWALLVGAQPRGPGMERSDLIRANGPIFVNTGKALNTHAASDVRVVVVGNPCNTNCLITMHNAPDLAKDRFHAMTRLDQNRAMTQLAKKANIDVNQVKNMVIWGNHSTTQVVDSLNVRLAGQSAMEKIGDSAYLRGEFSDTVAKRGGAIIAARGKSSAASAASACIDAVRSLVNETPQGEVFSSAVWSNGNPYGIAEGLIFSFPCRSNGDGTYEIVEGFEWDDFLKGKIETTTNELLKEREIVGDLLG